MTDPNRTSILVILDRSGSMATCAPATIAGFNAFLAEQRQAPGIASLTLIQFNEHCVMTIPDRPIGEVLDLSPATYQPGGGTALYDAMGMGMSDLGRVLEARPEASRPGKVVVVIITDGEENSSRVYNAAQIKSMTEHQRAVYGWQFVYLGANHDAITAARSVGIDVRTASHYTTSNMGHAFTTTSSNIREYRAAGASGQSLVYTAQQVAAMNAPQEAKP